jgi:L-alanine-DL-glutamate epimerase-like enolase superfamily enzyme
LPSPQTIRPIGELCIRLGRARKYNMAWLEDAVPWHRVPQWRQITEAIDVPTLVRGNVYLKGRSKSCAGQAVDIVHPVPVGHLEIKRIGDMAQEYGSP